MIQQICDTYVYTVDFTVNNLETLAKYISKLQVKKYLYVRYSNCDMCTLIFLAGVVS